MMLYPYYVVLFGSLAGKPPFNPPEQRNEAN